MNVNPFAHHETALNLRAARSEILSSNIANADTPGFQARDVAFKSAFRTALSEIPAMRTTDRRHLPAPAGAPGDVSVGYRVPLQPSVDGNTVEADVEQAQFAENAVRYRATLSFLSSQVSGLRYAIKGSD